MTTTPDRGAGFDTYTNPVYEQDFPDPYVLKYRGEYWAYCTGRWRDGRCFGVMHSRDLVHWRELGGALTPLAGDHPCYWAPEVYYRNGRLLMYYSVGNEKRMHIRVATAAQPGGPFTDSGHALTDAEFAIDAHVYAAPDGTRWLFYATDFLTHTHIGTGTVRDQLLDDFTLAGSPRPVTRARYDWQVYDPHRSEKGGVRWHTVEGPFVLAHKGRLYEMFSGGNWQNVSYGVSYALTDSLETEGEWQQVADGERVLPILRTLPGEVIGPGHNSVVRGPDNRQLFCVYHEWREGRGRVLAIDRLDFVGERMTVLGPTTTPQPAPNAPTFTDFFAAERPADLGVGWTCVGGRWATEAGAARQAATTGPAAAVCAVSAESFLVEVQLQALPAPPAAAGAYGVRLDGATGPAALFTIMPQTGQAMLSLPPAGEHPATRVQFDLPADFDPRVQQLLQIEIDQTFLRLALAEQAVRWAGRLPAAPAQVALYTDAQPAAFAGFALTVGWADLFTDPDWRARGWTPMAGDADWRVVAGELVAAADPAAGAWLLCKGAPLAAYELVVNVRRIHDAGAGGCYGFYPAYAAAADTMAAAADATAAADRGPLLTVEPTQNGGWALVAYAAGHAGAGARQEFSLPASFDPTQPQQFRVRNEHGWLHLQCEATVLGALPAPARPARIALYAHGAVAFESVRVTALSSVAG